MTRSDIAHYSGLDLWGPVSMQAIARLLEPLELRRGLHVLDVGCGQATVLIHLAERLGARIQGVDRSAAALDRAREEIARRVPTAQATWTQCGIDDLAFEAGIFDLIVALGGPYRHDAIEETLALYARWLRPAGYLLYGDGFWVQPPPTEYLAATGLTQDELLSREAYLDQARRCRLDSLDHHVATRDAWDRFEGTVLRNHEAYAREHAGEPEVEAMIARKRAWADAQERWGRDTMGFVVDVFRLRTRDAPPAGSA